MKKILMTAGAAVFALSTAASAATLSIVGGTDGTIPSNGQTNEILADMGMATLDGFFGSQIELSADSELRIEFLGLEAGFENTFTMGGDGFNSEDFPSDLVLPSSFGAAGLPAYTFDAVAGLLNFLFTTSGDGGTIDNDVANGDDNLNNFGFTNFFASFGDDSRTGTTLMLFFDDTGGTQMVNGELVGDDDNHDDFAIRISVVPLPGAAIPLLTALAGLGYIGRRRRNAAKV